MDTATALNRNGQRTAYILLLAATVLGLTELGLYISTGETQFNTYLPKAPIILLSVGVILGVISVFYTVRPLIFCQYLCFFAGFLLYVVSQLNYIVNVIDGRDGNTLSAALITALVSGVFAWILSLAAGIVMKKDRLTERIKDGKGESK